MSATSSAERSRNERCIEDGGRGFSVIRNAVSSQFGLTNSIAVVASSKIFNYNHLFRTPAANMEYANNSFYTALNFFSGITFGAFEFTWMQGTFLRVDVLAFLLLSLAPLVFLCGLKSKYVIAGVKLYALRRPYRHILADYLFSASTAASFSVLVFIYSRGLSIIDKDLAVPAHSAVLLGNLVMFAFSVFLYSLLAKEERFVKEPERNT